MNIKKKIITNEWYPVFEVESLNSNTTGVMATFTQEELYRIEKAFEEFNEVQNLLSGKLFELAKTT